MEKFIIECRAPEHVPVDWYHVGVRHTEQAAIEAMEWHKARDYEETEWRYRKVEF